MHKLKESIEINAPLHVVFGLLKNIDVYLRLNPHIKVIWIEKLSKEEPSLWSRYRIIINCRNKRLDFITEWVEYEENKKIVSVESTGKTKLTLRLEEISSGTLLIHEEEFEIPFEIVFKEDFDEGEVPLWRKILFFARPDPDIEYSLRAEKLKEKLRVNLKEFLSVIKEKAEKGSF